MLINKDITVTVPTEIAEVYYSASSLEREELQLKIVALIQAQLTNHRQQSIMRLRETIDKLSSEAQANGLTPVILESILNDTE